MAERLATSTALSSTEVQVIHNELNSPVFNWLPPEERHDKLVDILMQVKLITGAILHPPGDELRLQVMVLYTFISTSRRFSSLTTNEILHAFYLNSQGEYGQIYRHYNRELNAEFVGDVLLAYLKFKDAIYARQDVRALLDPPKVKPAFVMPSDAEFMQFIQADYNLYREKKTEFIFFSLYKYNLLRRLGLIEIFSRANWTKIFGFALGDRIRYANKISHDPYEQMKIRELARIYETYQNEGWIPRTEYRVIIGHLRKKLYFRFFEVIKGCAINDIFTEIQIRR